MSRRRIVGFMAIVVLVPVVALVWRLAGVSPPPPESDPVARADAGGGGGVCQVGVCKRFVDRQPGCTTIPCCPEGETYCDSVSRVSVASYQKLVSPSGGVGGCYVFGPEEVEVCEYYDCGGTMFCSDPSCSPIATRWIFTRPKAVPLGPCQFPD